MLRRPGGLRARRPRHPLDRSLLRRLLALSCARGEAAARTPAADHRQRAALPDGRPDAARAAERSPLPRRRRKTTRAPLPGPALAVALQRALPSARAQARHPLAGDRLRAARLPRLAELRGHDAPSLRAERLHRQPLRARALVRLRLLGRPLPLLLGDAARALVRPRRLRARLRPCPRQRGRTGGG